MKKIFLITFFLLLASLKVRPDFANAQTATPTPTPMVAPTASTSAVFHWATGYSCTSNCATDFSNPGNARYNPDKSYAYFSNTTLPNFSVTFDPIDPPPTAWGALIAVKIDVVGYTNGNAVINLPGVTGCNGMLATGGTKNQDNYFVFLKSTCSNIVESALENGTIGVGFTWYYGLQTTTFNIDSVGIMPIYASSPQQTSSVNTLSIYQTACNPLDIACNFFNLLDNIFSFFTPHIDTVALAAFQTNIENKAPFAYINHLSTLNLAATTATDSPGLISLPITFGTESGVLDQTITTDASMFAAFKGFIVNMKTLLTVVIWLGFIGYLVHLASRVNN